MMTTDETSTTDNGTIIHHGQQQKHQQGEMPVDSPHRTSPSAAAAAVPSKPQEDPTREQRQRQQQTIQTNHDGQSALEISPPVDQGVKQVSWGLVNTEETTTTTAELPPFHHVEQDDDMFSDVFQGELLIEVTKNIEDMEEFLFTPHFAENDDGGYEKDNSTVVVGKEIMEDDTDDDVIVEKVDNELVPTTIHEDEQYRKQTTTAEQDKVNGEKNVVNDDNMSISEHNQITIANSVEIMKSISSTNTEELGVKQGDVEYNIDDLSLDIGEDSSSLAHRHNVSSALNSSVYGEPWTEHCNNMVLPSIPISEKRRERRKLRGQLSREVTSVSGGGLSTTTTTTTKTTTIRDEEDIPTVSNERFEISSVGSCVKIRERRKKTVLDVSVQQQSKLPNYTAFSGKQDTEVDATVGVADSHKSFNSSTPKDKEVLPIKSTSPELQIALIKRRHKIVERVGKHKVPIIAKKAWLQTRASIDAMAPSSPSSDIDTVSLSAVATSKVCDDGDGKYGGLSNHTVATTGNCSPPHTSTSALKKPPADNTVSSPITPISGVGSISSPCSQQSIASGEEGGDIEGIQTPFLVGTSLERHMARSQRRQLRSHAGIVDMKLVSPEGIQEITPLPNPGSPSSLEKHKARSQRRQQRKGRGTSNEELNIFGKAMTPTHESSEVEGCAVDVAEAKALFPEDASSVISSSQRYLDCIPLGTDTAWDVSGASELNSMLELSKAGNSERIDSDARPLLHLDYISSSGNDVTKSLECASAKLLTQQERMRMYNSGRFGESDDSSVDNDEEEELEAEEEVLNSKYIGNDASDNIGVEVFEYEATYNYLDDEGECDQDDAIYHSVLQLQPPNGGIDNAPTFAFSKSRALRWDQNPDAMSEIESDFFDPNICVTDDTVVEQLRFVGQAVCGKPPHNTPSPQSSSSFELDQDVTPKIGPNGTAALDVRNELTSAVELPKIPPPPPEKLRDWEQSTTNVPLLMAGQDSSPEKNLELNQNGNNNSPRTPKVGTACSGSHSPPETQNVNYKIQRSKSPQKKKQPHSLTDELDLAGHTRMAEKIVIATSKAARKFEEQYSNLTKSGDKALDPYVAKGDSHYHAGDAPSVSPSHKVSPGSHIQVPAVGELVGGAFSPWKIPDRAEDESSIASLARMLQENESYARATAAAVNTILGRHDEKRTAEGNQDESVNESFEVRLGDEEAGGSLTSVLQWLFCEVLPLNSPIVAAFSAFDINTSTTVQSMRVLAIANDEASFNLICNHVATSVMMQCKRKIDDDTDTAADRLLPAGGNSKDIPTSESAAILSFEIPPTDDDGISRPTSDVLAASFVNFVQEISKITGVTSPFPDDCSLATDIVSLKKPSFLQKDKKTVQQLIFPNEDRIVAIFRFLRKACVLSTEMGHVLSAIDEDKIVSNENDDASPTPTRASELATSPPTWLSSENRAKEHSTVRRSNRRKASHKLSSTPITVNPLLIVPKENPSPFETAVWNQPSILLSILSFLGNPVAVCAVKRLNVFCSRVVRENQHVLMRDAVRLGGMSKFVRPSFWLWVTEMCKPEDPIPLIQSKGGSETMRALSNYPQLNERNFLQLKEAGAHGKWYHVIERDVTRAFGNMPPHKTGARYRQDSIVRALVSFGREEIIRNSRSYQAMDKLPEGSEAKHFKLSSRLDCRDDSSHQSSGSVTPTDTVSDWGGISPVGSFISEDPSTNINIDESIRVVSYESGEILDANVKPVKLNLSQHTSKSEVSDPVLSGNALTSEMKVDLQNKLRSILHALAARHEAVGYCQGMDYIVAHLLRVLQDTILLRIIQRSIPANQNQSHDHGKTPQAKDWRTISSDELRAKMSDLNSQTVVVEEIVFGVMDTFFSTYNLQHMYWPELRCLKTCCRVFEILIKQKLPVLADHFQHYDLNVGIFALGWFQTLFLYLPSMPSATVCHIWDIWLVERSFKIFFRVGTAILFLSQPTLLNNDLEGMMTYLNTFPDATLLRRDILIPCALQIKITNRMLVEIEMEVANSNHFLDHNNNEYFPV